MTEQSKQRPGERARDEQRESHGPVYGGEQDWKVADERGEQRFGIARNDDSDPETIGRAHGPDESKLQAEANRARSSDEVDRLVAREDDERDDDDDLDIADTEIESGGEHAGMGRGENPRKDQPRGGGFA